MKTKVKRRPLHDITDTMKFIGVVDWLKVHKLWTITVEGGKTVATYKFPVGGKTITLGFKHKKADIGTAKYRRLVDGLREAMAQAMASVTE